MTGVQALLLPVGDDLYALPMTWVREVVAAPRLTRLVTAPPIVLGLFNLRGHIVALLDTAALLGTGTTGAAALAFAVVVDGPRGPAGLATTGFPQRGVLEVPTGESELPGTNGMYQVDEQIVVLLDPVALLTPESVAGLDVRPDLEPGTELTPARVA
jgi:purine-binding chemotaxis protein CheW